MENKKMTTLSNREKINFIENTVSKKGYSYNAFKLEYIAGQKDVVWNIPVAPHRVCEYFNFPYPNAYWRKWA